MGCTKNDTDEQARAETKEIVLSNGMVALVDAADFEWLNQWKWQATCSRDSFRKRLKWYACRYETVKFKTRPSKRKKIYMHRLIVGFPKGKVVDHASGDGLDNRRKNLSPATYYRNAKNTFAQGVLEELDVFDEAIAAQGVF